MAKWRWQTDLKAGLSALIVYVAYLIYLFYKAPFYTSSLGYNDVGCPVVSSTETYFYLQFIPCILIVFLTSSIFGECFRGSVRAYLLTFPIKTSDVIIKRYLRLFALLVILHIPIVLFAVSRINTSMDIYISSFPQYTGFPHVPFFPLIIQCTVGMAFYIALAISLIFLLRNKYLPVILMVVYCILEAGPLIGILGKYCIFYGSFIGDPIYNYFPENMVLMLFLTALLLTIVSIKYRPVGKQVKIAKA